MARRSAPRVSTTSRLLQRIWPGVRSTGSCRTTENGEGQVSKADRFHALAETPSKQGGDSPPPQCGRMVLGRWQEEAWNASNQKSSPSQGWKGRTSPGMERNNLLAAHCPSFDLCYPKTLQGITEASSKAHSQRSCPVRCQWEESAAAIGSGPGSPALLQQPLLGRRHALPKPGYPKRRPFHVGSAHLCSPTANSFIQRTRCF